MVGRVMEMILNHGLTILLLFQFGIISGSRTLKFGSSEAYGGGPGGKSLLTNIFERTAGELRRNLDDPIVLPIGPIIGPFPNDTEQFNLVADFTDSSLSTFVNGVFHSCNANLSGLSSFVDNAQIELEPGELRFRIFITIGNISLTSTNDGLVSLLNLVNISSYGDFSFELNDASVEVSLAIMVPEDEESDTDPVNVTRTGIDVSVGGVKLVGEDTLFNTTDDWDLFFVFIASMWPNFQPMVEGLLLQLAKGLLLNCTLEDLGAVDFSCLALDGFELPIEFVDELTCGPRPTNNDTAPTEGPPSGAIPSPRTTPALVVALISVVILKLRTWS